MFNRRHVLKVASMGVLGSLVPAQVFAAAKRLLFIHGRAQQGRDPVALRAEWIDALRGGSTAARRRLPDDVDIALPFYGDALDKLTRAASVPLTSEVRTRGEIDDEFLVFQAEFAESVRQAAGVTDAQVDAEYGNRPGQRGPLNWEWVQAILRAVDKHGGGVSQNALELVTRDVFLYCTRPGVMSEVDQIVASQLTEEPTVVVAHSLGSVVAYNILRTDRRRLQIPLLVTVGSPLGIRSVRDQFRPLRYPTPVADWSNAFDKRDVVALYPLDQQNFPVQPRIQNDDTVNNGTGNRHGIVGYLTDGDVAKRIVDPLIA